MQNMYVQVEGGDCSNAASETFTCHAPVDRNTGGCLSRCFGCKCQVFESRKAPKKRNIYQRDHFQGGSVVVPDKAFCDRSCLIIN